jgi:LAO/AO transport system kinase
MSLYDKFLEGSVVALSRIITHIEDRGEGYQELLSRLYRRTTGIYRIGLTGPPGGGKSSLVNSLAGLLVEQGRKVAIVCVDPSSPFTGGALLGDRLRMQDIPQDKGVFIRSMGSRGSTGGLALATSNVTVALDAFGFDTMIIETVGVGQMELDIIDACDTVVVVLVPESGDAIQALKAGLMEIADVFAVNKADRAGADQMIYDLQSALQMRTETSDWTVPAISTEAIHNKNIPRLLAEIEKHEHYLKTSGKLKIRRGHQLKKKIEQVIQRLINGDLRSTVVTEEVLNEVAVKIMNGEDDPFTAGYRLYTRYKSDR